MKLNEAEITKQLKELYPNISWLEFEECDRALNWELWNGQLPANYWTEAEPLEHYKWRGWEQACDDIVVMLAELPNELWVDDESYIYSSDPENDEAYWDEYIDDDGDKSYSWCGPESYSSIDPRQILMHVESYKQVF